MVLIDSYSETNQDIGTGLLWFFSSETGMCAAGQSFTCSEKAKITSVKFYLKKSGAPTGDSHAVLYAHSGTYGTSSVPTGDPLATSDAFDVTGLTFPYQLITFNFTGAQQYEMQDGTYYCIVYQNPSSGNIDDSNYVSVGLDASFPTHSGNFFNMTNSVWVAFDSRDIIFYVYGEPVVVVPPANPLIGKPLISPDTINKAIIR